MLHGSWAALLGIGTQERLISLMRRAEAPEQGHAALQLAAQGKNTTGLQARGFGREGRSDAAARIAWQLSSAHFILPRMMPLASL